MAIYANHVGINGNTGVRPGYKGNYMMVDSNFVSVPFNPPEVERSERSLDSIDELCSVEEHLRWWSDHSKDMKIPCSEEEYADIRVSPEYDPEIYYCICDPVRDLYISGPYLADYLDGKTVKSFGVNFDRKRTFAPEETPQALYFDSHYGEPGDFYSLYTAMGESEVRYGLIDEDRATVTWGFDASGAFEDHPELVKIPSSLWDTASFRYVTLTDSMFRNDTNFTTPFGGLELPIVTSMTNMFRGCSNYLGPAICGPKVVYANYAFTNCSNLSGPPIMGPVLQNAAYMYENTKIEGYGFLVPSLVNAFATYSQSLISETDWNLDNTSTVKWVDSLYSSCPMISYSEFSAPGAVRAKQIFMDCSRYWGRLGLNCDASNAYRETNANYPKHMYTDGFDVTNCYEYVATFTEGNNLLWNLEQNIYIHNTQGTDVHNLPRTTIGWLYPEEHVYDNIKITYGLTVEMEKSMCEETVHNCFRGDFDPDTKSVPSPDYLNMESNGTMFYDEYICNISEYRARPDMSNCYNSSLIKSLEVDGSLFPKEVRFSTDFYEYVVNADDMCSNCQFLVEDVSLYPWEYLTYANNMFQECISLTKGIIEKDLIYVQGMYNNCYMLIGSVYPYNGVNTSYLYCNCSNLEGDFYNAAYSTNTSHMFYECINVKGMPGMSLSAYDTSYMYYNCVGLFGIPVVPDDVTNAHSMYQGCSKVQWPECAIVSPDLEDAEMMFADCTKLHPGNMYLKGTDNIAHSNGFIANKPLTERIDIYVTEDSVTNSTFWNSGKGNLTGNVVDWTKDDVRGYYYNLDEKVYVHYKPVMKADFVWIDMRASADGSPAMCDWGKSGPTGIKRIKITGGM